MNPTAKTRTYTAFPRITEPRVKRCADPDAQPTREKTRKPRRDWQ